jgi:hypothetical protein
VKVNSTVIYEDTDPNSRPKYYYEGKPPVADDTRAKPGYGVRTVYNGTASQWVLLAHPPPCYLLSWARTWSSQRYISVVAPPWQGRVSVVVRAEIDSAPSSEQTYERPVIESVTPAALPPHGGVITVRGRHFGAQQDPVDGLLALQALHAANGDAYMDVDAGKRGMYNSSVFVVYDGDDDVPTNVNDRPERRCHVQRPEDWSDTAITCLAPRGVPGAPYVVYVLQSDDREPALFRSTRPTVLGHYAAPNVTGVFVPAAAKPAAGGYNVTLTGLLFALNCTAGAQCGGASSSPAGTPAVSPSASGSATAVLSASASMSASATGSESPTSSASSTASGSVGASRSASPSTSGTSTATASLRGTESPSGTTSPSASASAAASPSGSSSGTRTATGSGSTTASASTTPSCSPTNSVSGSVPATPSGSASASLSTGTSPSATPMPSSTASSTATPAASTTPVPPPAEPLSYGWDGEWVARVILEPATGKGRLPGGLKSIPLGRDQRDLAYRDRVLHTSDGSLTFLMPPALGVINITVQFVREMDGVVVSEDTLVSQPVQLTVDNAVITAVETFNNADDPCKLLKYHAAMFPCDDIAPARSPFRTQNLTHALRACYVNTTVPAAFAVPPMPGAASAAALLPDTADIAISDRDGATACNVTFHPANRSCTARGSDYCGAGVPLACTLTPTGNQQQVNVSVSTTAAGGGEAVCSALIDLPPLSLSGNTTVYVTNATVGGWAVVTSPTGVHRKPCGATPAWRLVGSCSADDVVGWTPADILARCYGVPAQAARDANASVAVAAGSPETIAACDLVETVLHGRARVYAGWIVDPVDEAAMNRVRANTFCWPRFPLSRTSDGVYASCVKANTNLRRMRIRGKNFGVVDVPVVDVKIDGVDCERPVVESDAAVTCEINVAKPLRVGDLPAVVVARFDRDESSGVFYNTSEGVVVNGTGRWPAEMTVRSVCRLGTRYDHATRSCAACPDDYNGECLGGDGELPFFAPRAVAKFWRTDPAEWLAQRSLDVAAVAPGDFVRCAVPDLCLPNQLCRTGSSG